MAYNTTDYLTQTYAALPGIAQFSGGINAVRRNLQQQANLARLGSATPGLEAQSLRNISQKLAGKVSSSTLGMMGQGAAERGIGRGIGIDTSSPNINAAYLKALGLTSEGLQKEAEQELAGAYARNPAAPLWQEESSLIINPVQSAQLELERDKLNQQRKLEEQRLALEARRINQEMALRSAAAGGGGGARLTAGGGQTSTAPTMSDIFTAYGSGRGINYTPMTYGSYAPAFDYSNYVSPGMNYGGEFDVVQPGMNLLDTGNYGGEFDVVQPGMNYADTTAYGDVSYGYQPTSSGTMYIGDLAGYEG